MIKKNYCYCIVTNWADNKRLTEEQQTANQVSIELLSLQINRNLGVMDKKNGF
jgi:hypothetical protein